MNKSSMVTVEKTKIKKKEAGLGPLKINCCKQFTIPDTRPMNKFVRYNFPLKKT